MSTKIREQNFQIAEIGLRYTAHFNCCEVVLYGDDFAVTIPIKRMRDFTNLFPDINWEDGYMLHKLKDRYMRCVECDGRVIGLKHITKDLTFMLDEE